MAEKPGLNPTDFQPKPTSALYPGDLDTRRAFDHTEESVNRASPFAKWQYVSVTFPSTANIDVLIPHKLNPNDPESVLWIPLNFEEPSAPAAAAYIYRDAATNRRAWQRDYIVLRSPRTLFTCLFLLALPRKVSNAAQSIL